MPYSSLIKIQLDKGHKSQETAIIRNTLQIIKRPAIYIVCPQFDKCQ